MDIQLILKDAAQLGIQPRLTNNSNTQTILASKYNALNPNNLLPKTVDGLGPLNPKGCGELNIKGKL